MPDSKLILQPSGGGPPRNAVKEVVGRDEFVKEIMRFLDYTSVQLTAPRRIGKSWVLYLLEAKAQNIATPVYFDLESVHTPYQFIDSLAVKVKSRIKQMEAAIGQIIVHLASGGYGKMDDYEFPWKEHLDGILKKLNKHDKPIWLIFDEFPLFINHFIVAGKHQISIQLLDYLRYARDEYKNIRFITTGSIGFHWIIEKLKEKGWRNPQNKDQRLTLGVLQKEYAVLLTEGLFRGLEKDVDSAHELAVVVDFHPFYIQRTVGLWHHKKDGEDIRAFCNRIALEKEDHYEFMELDNRLGDYFGRDAGNARKVLDCLAEGLPITPHEVANRLNLEPEYLKNILNKLEMDGYTEVKERKHHLWPPLFRNWWKNKRGDLYE